MKPFMENKVKILKVKITEFTSLTLKSMKNEIIFKLKQYHSKNSFYVTDKLSVKKIEKYMYGIERTI